MIFDDTVIRRKEAAIAKHAQRTMTDITADLGKLFGDVRDVHLMKRHWHPGGGATLVNAVLGGQDVFIKIKDKTLTVESRLEHEQIFLNRGSLDNEAMFLTLLRDDPHVPKLKAYKEDHEYAYAVFERLSSFEEGIKELDAHERYRAFLEIENTVRRLYDKGIVHTDLHEKNILFRDKQIVLCDFEEARLLLQENIPFEQSLDVIGENRYGNVGNFPEGHGLPGLTALTRLRNVFKPLIKDALPALLEKCHFSNDCAFNADTLQDKDERIYQSVDLGDSRYAGQRPMHDHRHEVLARLLAVIAERLGSHMHVVDIGSNLGTLSFTAAHSPDVAKVTGLEAFEDYVRAAEVLAFLFDEKKVHFAVNQAGTDPMPREPIDVLLLFSVYHHIRDRETFLREIAKNRPRTIIAEMAVQERYYPERGDLTRELQYMGRTLGYKTLQIIGITSDYQRPICLFSDDPTLNQPTLDKVMGMGGSAPATGNIRATQAETKFHPEAKRSYPMKVSVVLPTYNHAHYLLPAIQSIAGQTFSDFELIIVNDGSTDETLNLLSQIQHPKIKVITQNNQGLPSALNNGFATAQGEYWTWTSADNIVGPTWLEELVKALEESPQDVGYALSAYAQINDRNQIIGIDNNQSFETWRMLYCNGNASFLYKSEVARKTGPYDVALNGAEDMDMWIRMSQITRAVKIESVLYYYRLHQDSMTAQIPEKIRNASMRMIEKFLASSGGRFDVERLFPDIRKSANPALARWQARVWLSAQLTTSPFCPWDATANLIKESLAERFEPSLVGNVAKLFAATGRWDSAAEALATYAEKDHSGFIQNLSPLIERHDIESLNKIPFVTIADQALSFNRTRQLSRSEMLASQ